MWLLFASFIAWMLTILAPCVLPILPVILAGSLWSYNKYRPLIITVSFAISVIVFTLILKLSISSFGIDQSILEKISATILILFGFFLLFPEIWDYISMKTGLHNAWTSSNKKWVYWDILLGFSLWPIFNSCSPTYAIIVAIILPVSFFEWLTYLLAYTLWFSLILLLIWYQWMWLISRFKRIAHPKSWFKRIMGVLLIIVWVVVASWYEKTLQTKLLDTWLFDNLVNLEQWLLDKFHEDN